MLGLKRVSVGDTGEALNREGDRVQTVAWEGPDLMGDLVDGEAGSAGASTVAMGGATMPANGVLRPWQGQGLEGANASAVEALSSLSGTAASFGSSREA